MSKYNIKLTNAQVNELDLLKCSLYQVVKTLSDVVKAEHLRTIRNTVALIDEILKPMHKADDAKQRAVQKEVQRFLLTKDTSAQYSFDEKPSAQICDGPVRFVRSSGWARSNEITYKSEIVHNPTYGDAFNAFTQSIEVTGDTHHVFFEGVDRIGAIDNVAIYTLLSGS